MNLIEVLSSEKEELAKEIRPLRDRCSSLQTGLNDSIKAKEAIELDANNAKRFLVIFRTDFYAAGFLLELDLVFSNVIF